MNVRLAESVDLGKLRNNFAPVAKFTEFDNNTPSRTCGASHSQKRFSIELFACKKDIAELVCVLKPNLEHTCLYSKLGTLTNPQVTDSRRSDRRTDITFHVFNLFYDLHVQDNYGVLK